MTLSPLVAEDSGVPNKKRERESMPNNNDASAFPKLRSFGDETLKTMGGLTLRQWIAAQVLPAIIAKEGLGLRQPELTSQIQIALSYADELLEQAPGIADE